MLQILFLSPERAEAKSKRRIFNGLSLKDERVKEERLKELLVQRSQVRGTSLEERMKEERGKNFSIEEPIAND